jgi:hypothetical protein
MIPYHKQVVVFSDVNYNNPYKAIFHRYFLTFGRLLKKRLKIQIKNGQNLPEFLDLLFLKCVTVTLNTQ